MKKIFTLIAFYVLVFLCFNKANAQDVVYKNTDRFVLCQLSDFRRDQYLIDTSTGKVWCIVMNSDSIRVYEQVYYADENDKISSTPNPSDTKSYIGRYKLKQISEYRRDQFLIDTETGKTWNIVSSEKYGHLFEAIKFDE